ncbi:hypothetical protein Q9L58_010557 [Maublancomyces gigas]|uniref:Uncharacterized protein n=1 Tax=Discina gigas TaxID=1032678 RepID=A0ABR3G3S0_9PEZI
MPPKHDSKGMLQSPTKGESYASIVVGSVASRTRGAGGRRPSNEGLESIASEADLAQYDTSSGSGTSGNGSSRSMPSTSSAASSSTPAAAQAIDPEIAHLIGLLVTRVQATSTSTSSASAKPPSAATPKPSAPAHASASASSGGSGGSITLEPSMGRLMNGMSSITGLSVLPSTSTGGATTIPGGASTNEEHDSDADDEKDQPPSRPSANDLTWKHIHVAEADRWAPGTVANVLAHFPSFQARANVVRCKDGRNAREVDTLSAIADAAHARRSDVVLELVIRRIFGIEEADNSGGRDWDTATVLDLTKPGALGNDDLRRRMRKDAAQLKANRPKTAPKSRTAAGTGGAWKKKTGNGQGGKGNYGGSGTRSGGGSGNTATKQ